MNLRPVGSERWNGRFLIGLMVLQAVLLVYGARVHSPTWDEVGHLAAGISHWELGRFELYSVNPPLVRTIATAPVMLFDKPHMDWSFYRNDPKQRSEIFLGRRMMQLNGERILGPMFLARVAVLPIALVGTWFCFLWGRELFGSVAGLVSAFLWALSPMVLAYGAVITPDLAAAVSFVVATFVFWSWLRQPNWSWTVSLIAVTGVAMLTKSVWLTLPAIYAVIWLAKIGLDRFFCNVVDPKAVGDVITAASDGAIGAVVAKGSAIVQRPSVSTRLLAVQFAQLFVIAGGALLLTNGLYGFRNSFRPLGEFQFASRMLAGPSDCEGCGEQLGNRFRATIFAGLPVPLPANYLEGIDIQRRDFERGSTDVAWQSYLFGQWRQGGWWYFYLVGLFVKTPLVVWCLLAISLVSLSFCRLDRTRRLGILCLVIPALLVLGLLSFNTGMNRYVRYALPIVPAICIMATSFVGIAAVNKGLINLVASSACLLLTVVSIGNAPHWLSYFNAVAGGPARGHEVLADSNVDWGQDFLLLKRWLALHPEAAGELRLAAFSSYDPVCLGIDYRLPPPMYPDPARLDMPINSNQGPQPGWYVISKNYLAGHLNPAPDGADRMQFEYLGQAVYQYFRHFRPVDRIGQSMLVYRLEPKDVERFQPKPPLAGAFSYAGGVGAGRAWFAPNEKAESPVTLASN